MLMRKFQLFTPLLAATLVANACKHTNDDANKDSSNDGWVKDSFSRKTSFSFAQAQEQDCNGLTPFEINQLNVLLGLEKDYESCKSPTVNTPIVKKMAGKSKRSPLIVKCLKWVCGTLKQPAKNK